MKMSQQRKYLPTLSELIDRLSIAQLKEVFIPEHKAEYAQEISDICHDIQLILDSSSGKMNAETVRAIIVLSQMNLHIWHNESQVRAGSGSGNLSLTHGLNGFGMWQKTGFKRLTAAEKIIRLIV